MLFFCLSKDKDVVQIDDYVSFMHKFPECFVHVTLEGCRGVGETKEHDRWLEESLISSESCLPLITFLDPDVIITPSDIKFGKEARVLGLVNEFLDQWQGVLVLDRHVIELSVILNWS